MTVVTGIVFNIQRYSVHDGPGIRTTVFLKGCPLRCLWCHNPEGISPCREVTILESRCISCGECLKVCPCINNGRLEVLRESDDITNLFLAYNEKCTLCGKCVDVCPSGARMFIGCEYTPMRLTQELLKDRLFFDESDGGITFSGGEPLNQPEFLIESIVNLKRHEIHIAVDTCGFAPHHLIKEIARFVDLFLFDFKFISPNKHRKYTGVDNALIIENLAILNDAHKNIWIRIPIIPGVNSSDGEIGAIVEFLKPFKSIRQINLLPFHKTGIHKTKTIRKNNYFTEFKSPTAEEMALIKSKFSTLNIPVKIGG